MKKTFFKQVTLIFALGLAGASMFSACKRDEPVINPNPITPTDSINPINPNDTIKYRDVDLYFSGDDLSYTNFIVSDKYGNEKISRVLMRYDSMPDVRYIYMVVGDFSFLNYNYDKIKKMKEKILKPVMDFSEKTRGKGIFYFKSGEASKIPEDSLWITKQGWEIVPMCQ